MGFLPMNEKKHGQHPPSSLTASGMPIPRAGFGLCCSLPLRERSVRSQGASAGITGCFLTRLTCQQSVPEPLLRQSSRCSNRFAKWPRSIRSVRTTGRLWATMRPFTWPLGIARRPTLPATNSSHTWPPCWPCFPAMTRRPQSIHPLRLRYASSLGFTFPPPKQPPALQWL